MNLLGFFGLILILKFIHYTSSQPKSLSELQVWQNMDLNAVLVIQDGFSEINAINYFGLTISLVNGNSRASSFDPGWVFIGAPKSNFTEGNIRESYFEPGYIWRCKLGGAGSENCEILQFTKQICNARNTESGTCDSSFMGGSLEFRNGIFVSCASNWKRERNYPTLGLRMDGACYWMRESAALDELLPGQLNQAKFIFPGGDQGSLVPFKERAFNRPEYLATQGVARWYFAGAGISVHVSANKDILLGAPGVLGWSGTFLDLKHSPQRPYQQWKFANMEVYSSKQYYLNLLGYAVTSGNFRTKDETLFAISSPRAEVVEPKDRFATNMPGAVLIVRERALTLNTRYDPSSTRAPHWLHEIFIEGEQYGSYFGACLESVDINQDGLMELLVGAPFVDTGKVGKQSSSSGDHGCVYIYSLRNWKSSDSFKKRICGDAVGGRFGTSIAQLGDLNQDGYNDFAVGAPYAEDGGAVYIFWGDRDFTLKRIKISGSNYYPAGTTSPFGFGISLTGDVDLDGNGTPDFGVGNYLSKNVIIFRTRPKLIIRSQVNFLENEVKKQGIILEKNAVRFTIEVCVAIRVTLSIKNNEEFPKDGIVIWGKVIVDRESKRFFIRRLTEIVTKFIISEKTRQKCETFEATRQVAPEDLIQDQDDVTFQHILWYNATENKQGTHLTIDKSRAGQPNLKSQGPGFMDFCSSCPYPMVFEPKALEIPFRKDCKRREEVGDYPVCKPVLTVTMKGRYGTNRDPTQRVEHEMTLNFGDSPWLAIQIFVRNSNQTAYSPMINLAWKWDNTRLNLTIPTLSVLTSNCDIYKENATANCHLDRAKAYLGKDEEKSVGLLFNMNEIFAVSPEIMRFSVHAEVYLQGDTKFVAVRKSFLVNYLVNASLGKMEGVLTNVTFRSSNSFQYRFKLTLPGKSPIPLFLNFYLPESIKINGGKAKFFEIEDMLINKLSAGHYCSNTTNDGRTDIVATLFEKEMKGRTRGRKTLWGKVYDANNWKASYCRVPITRYTRNLDISFRTSLADNKLATSLIKKEGSLDFHGFGYAEIFGKYSTFNVSQIIINRPEDKEIPAWIYIAAAVGGLILLFLFIVCLNKCGFFKRSTKDKLALLKAEADTEDAEISESAIQSRYNDTSEENAVEAK